MHAIVTDVGKIVAVRQFPDPTKSFTLSDIISLNHPARKQRELFYAGCILGMGCIKLLCFNTMLYRGKADPRHFLTILPRVSDERSRKRTNFACKVLIV